jgi:hypothetical protein
MFLGPPGRLRFAAPAEAGARGRTPVSVALPQELERYVDARHAPLRGAGAGEAAGTARRPARLRLAAHTPPGTYRIGVQFADGQREEAAVTVEPRPRLRVSPSALRLAGAPGTAVSARLLVENRGNLTVHIDETLVTGLFDDDGIESALAAVYRLETHDLNEIVGTGFARLREAHGGLLKLRVRAGAGPLAPGEQRSLLVETVLGRKLAARHGYHGTVDIGPHTLAVEVSVLEA